MFQIGLHHGLRMLSIFKDFQARTCILDDFAFYEEKEKSLRASRSAGQQVARRHCSVKILMFSRVLIGFAFNLLKLSLNGKNSSKRDPHW